MLMLLFRSILFRIHIVTIACPASVQLLDLGDATFYRAGSADSFIVRNCNQADRHSMSAQQTCKRKSSELTCVVVFKVQLQRLLVYCKAEEASQKQTLTSW